MLAWVDSLFREVKLQLLAIVTKSLQAPAWGKKTAAT